MADKVSKLLELLQKGAEKELILSQREEEQAQPSAELIDQQKMYNQEIASKSLQSQVQNTAASLENVGVDPTKYSDTRNPLEKLFNVQQNQNWLFDIFEVLQRPQQALFNAALNDEWKTGKTGAEAMWEGLTGQAPIVYGGQLLRDKMGFADNPMTHLVGGLMDVFLDPADIAFLPVAALSKGAKIGKVAAQIDDIVQASETIVKGIDKFGDVSKDVKWIDNSIKQINDIRREVSDFAHTASGAFDSDKLINSVASFSKETLDTGTKRILTNLETARAATWTINAESELLDANSKLWKRLAPKAPQEVEAYWVKFGRNYKIIKEHEKLLSPTDIVMRSLWGTAKSGFMATDDLLSFSAAKFGYGDNYNIIKNTLTQTFNVKKQLGKALDSYFEAFGKENVARRIAAHGYEELDSMLEPYATKNGLDLTDLKRVLQTDYVATRGKGFKTTVRLTLEDTNNVVPYTKEIYDLLRKNVIVPDGKLPQEVLPVLQYNGAPWISMRYLQPEMIKKGAGLNVEFDLPDLIPIEVRDTIQKFKETPEWSTFSKQVYDRITKMYMDISSVMGTDLMGSGDAAGYMRNALLEDIREKMLDEMDEMGVSAREYKRAGETFIGDPKTFQRRKYKAAPVGANVWEAANRMDEIRANQIAMIKGHSKMNGGDPGFNNLLEKYGVPGNSDIQDAILGRINTKINDVSDIIEDVVDDDIGAELFGKPRKIKKVELFTYTTLDGQVRRGNNLRKITTPAEYNRLVDLKATPEGAERILKEKGQAFYDQITTKRKVAGTKFDPLNIKSTKPKAEQAKFDIDKLSGGARKKWDSASDAVKKAKRDLKDKLGIHTDDELDVFEADVKAGRVLNQELLDSHKLYRDTIKTREQLRKQLAVKPDLVDEATYGKPAEEVKYEPIDEDVVPETKQASPTQTAQAPKVEEPKIKKEEPKQDPINAEIEEARKVAKAAKRKLKQVTGMETQDQISQFRKDLLEGKITNQEHIDAYNDYRKAVEARKSIEAKAIGTSSVDAQNVDAPAETSNEVKRLFKPYEDNQKIKEKYAPVKGFDPEQYYWDKHKHHLEVIDEYQKKVADAKKAGTEYVGTEEEMFAWNNSALYHDASEITEVDKKVLSYVSSAKSPEEFDTLIKRYFEVEDAIDGAKVYLGDDFDTSIWTDDELIEINNRANQTLNAYIRHLVEKGYTPEEMIDNNMSEQIAEQITDMYKHYIDLADAKKTARYYSFGNIETYYTDDELISLNEKVKNLQETKYKDLLSKNMTPEEEAASAEMALMDEEIRDLYINAAKASKKKLDPNYKGAKAIKNNSPEQKYYVNDMQRNLVLRNNRDIKNRIHDEYTLTAALTRNNRIRVGNNILTDKQYDDLVGKRPRDFDGTIVRPKGETIINPGKMAERANIMDLNGLGFVAPEGTTNAGEYFAKELGYNDKNFVKEMVNDGYVLINRTPDHFLELSVGQNFSTRQALSIQDTIASHMEEYRKNYIPVGDDGMPILHYETKLRFPGFFDDGSDAIIPLSEFEIMELNQLAERSADGFGIMTIAGDVSNSSYITNKVNEVAGRDVPLEVFADIAEETGMLEGAEHFKGRIPGNAIDGRFNVYAKYIDSDPVMHILQSVRKDLMPEDVYDDFYDMFSTNGKNKFYDKEIPGLFKQDTPTGGWAINDIDTSRSALAQILDIVDRTQTSINMKKVRDVYEKITKLEGDAFDGATDYIRNLSEKELFALDEALDFETFDDFVNAKKLRNQPIQVANNKEPVVKAIEPKSKNAETVVNSELQKAFDERGIRKIKTKSGSMYTTQELSDLSTHKADVYKALRDKVAEIKAGALDKNEINDLINGKITPEYANDPEIKKLVDEYISTRESAKMLKESVQAEADDLVKKFGEETTEEAPVKGKKNKSIGMADKSKPSMTIKIDIEDQKQSGIAYGVVKDAEDKLQMVKRRLMKEFGYEPSDFNMVKNPETGKFGFPFKKEDLDALREAGYSAEDIKLATLTNEYISRYTRVSKLYKEYGIKSLDELPKPAQEVVEGLQEEVTKSAQAHEIATQALERDEKIFGAVDETLKSMEKMPAANETNYNDWLQKGLIDEKSKKAVDQAKSKLDELYAQAEAAGFTKKKISNKSKIEALLETTTDAPTRELLTNVQSARSLYYKRMQNAMKTSFEDAQGTNLNAQYKKMLGEAEVSSGEALEDTINRAAKTLTPEEEKALAYLDQQIENTKFDLSEARTKILNRRPLEEGEKMTSLVKKVLAREGKVDAKLAALVDEYETIRENLKALNKSRNVIQPKISTAKKYVPKTADEIAATMVSGEVDDYAQTKMKANRDELMALNASRRQVEDQVEELVKDTLGFQEAKSVRHYLRNLDRDFIGSEIIDNAEINALRNKIATKFPLSPEETFDEKINSMLYSNDPYKVSLAEEYNTLSRKYAHTKSDTLKRLVAEYDDLVLSIEAKRLENAVERFQYIERKAKKQGKEFGEHFKEILTTRQGFAGIVLDVNKARDDITRVLGFESRDKMNNFVKVIEKRKITREAYESIAKVRETLEQLRDPNISKYRKEALSRALRGYKGSAMAAAKVKTIEEFEALMAKFPSTKVAGKADTQYDLIAKYIDLRNAQKEIPTSAGFDKFVEDFRKIDHKYTLSSDHKFLYNDESIAMAELLRQGVKTASLNRPGKFIYSTYADLYAAGKTIGRNEAMLLAGGDEKLAEDLMAVFQRKSQGDAARFLTPEAIEKAKKLTPEQKAEMIANLGKQRDFIELNPEQKRMAAVISDLTMRDGARSKLQNHVRKYNQLRRNFKDLSFTEYMKLVDETLEIPVNKELMDYAKRSDELVNAKETGLLSVIRKHNADLASDTLANESVTLKNLRKELEKAQLNAAPKAEIEQLKEAISLEKSKATRVAGESAVQVKLNDLVRAIEASDKTTLKALKNKTMLQYGGLVKGKKVYTQEAKNFWSNLVEYAQLKKKIEKASLSFDDAVKKSLDEFVGMKYSDPLKFYDRVQVVPESARTAARYIDNLSKTLNEIDQVYVKAGAPVDFMADAAEQNKKKLISQSREANTIEMQQAKKARKAAEQAAAEAESAREAEELKAWFRENNIDPEKYNFKIDEKGRGTVKGIDVKEQPKVEKVKETPVKAEPAKKTTDLAIKPKEVAPEKLNTPEQQPVKPAEPVQPQKTTDTALLNKTQAPAAVQEPVQTPVQTPVQKATAVETEEIQSVDMTDDEILNQFGTETIKGEDVLKKMPIERVTMAEYNEFIQDLKNRGVSSVQINKLDFDTYKKVVEEGQQASLDKLQNYKKSQVEFMKIWENRKIFEEDVTKSLADWVDVFPAEARNARVYKGIVDQMTQASLGKQINLQDENSLIRFVSKRLVENEKGGKGATGVFKRNWIEGTIPAGYVPVQNPDILLNKMRFANNLLKDANLDNAIDTISKQIKSPDFKHGSLVIEANTARLISRSYRRGANEILDVVDRANSLFKRNKLLSLAFNIRNFVGVVTNMWLSGMSGNEIMRFFGEADEVFKIGPELLKKRALMNEDDFVRTLLKDPKVAKQYNAYTKFLESGFTPPRTYREALEAAIKEGGIKGTAAEIQDVTSIAKHPDAKNLIGFLDRVSIANGNLNQTVDSMGRMAVLLKAMDGEAGARYMQKLSVGNPVEAVRLSMFDQKYLSMNEMEIVKRIIPFYTFSKMNLLYHMQNLPENAVRYHRFAKAIKSSWAVAGIDPNEVDDYKLEQMYLPIPGLTKDGKYYAIRANFPQSDLGEFFSNPVNRVAGMVSPLIKAPFEIATGAQAFTGQPIENYKGERSATLPFMDKKTEHLLSQTGFDVPARVLYGAAMLAGGDPAGLAQMTGIVTRGDVNSTKLSQQYQVLEDLKAGVNVLKSQGVIVPKITINKMQNRDAKLEEVNNALNALRKLRK